MISSAMNSVLWMVFMKYTLTPCSLRNASSCGCAARTPIMARFFGGNTFSLISTLMKSSWVVLKLFVQSGWASNMMSPGLLYFFANAVKLACVMLWSPPMSMANSFSLMSVS